MSQIIPIIAQAALTSSYALFGRHRVLAPQGFYKLVGGIALSALIHSGRRMSERKSLTEHTDTGLEIITHLATFVFIGAGAHLAKTPRKTALLSALFFSFTEALIDLAIHPRKDEELYKITIPRPYEKSIDEAYQIITAMKDGPLKHKATTLYYITVLRQAQNRQETYHSHIQLMPSTTLQFVHYHCEAAKLLNEPKILNDVFNAWIDLEDDKGKGAVMVALVRAHREINPSVDINLYLKHCSKESDEVNHWIPDGLKQPFPNQNAKLNETSPSPFTRFEVHLRRGELQEARLETRKIDLNLYWRVEALCRLAEAEAKAYTISKK
ncbi:MAG: hypothetical protein H7A38_03070 [Chlamydiales bacterium]|nr:hypothetical protein [Chlamydiales bacterium]